MKNNISNDIKKDISFFEKLENGDTLLKNVDVWNSAMELFVNMFKFDLSLKYPDKVILPLDDFANFYFKELDLASIYDKRDRAYNDSISMFLYASFTPKFNGYSSVNNFLETSFKNNKSYIQKAFFSKILAWEYLGSNDSAESLLNKTLNSSDWKICLEYLS
jgi:hypothetical protein